MNSFKYTQEQINKIANLLSQIKIEGNRQNIILFESIFQTLEQGEIIKDETKEGE